VLEEGAEAMAFSSGMAATMAVCQALLGPNTHVIISDDCYHGVAHLIKRMYARWGITYSEVDMTQPINVENAIALNTKLILVETPSNPLLKIADIEAICMLAKSRKIAVACDNTWATPCIIKPLTLGADYVIHSSTKYFGGHSDVIGGCVVVKEKNQASESLREYQTIGGVVPSPFDCWLLDRSIATLPLRIAAQTKNASVIANYLNGHPKIERVYYPELKTHVNHEVAKKQMKGIYGGMLSVLVKGGRKEAMRFANQLSIFKHATSLGGVESLIEHRLTSEGDNPKSADNLLRLSIGIEHIDDLLTDIKTALE
ncbi:MAG: aminotransferase class I/II-fold pyridoxal phosphate-dependent enzyme, partial [Bacteroidia bacterium]|nr:aminotransferase class I/II-fold pyridoxal phosphate-dependent enzyme [Bacteroidia bacterium]